MVVLVMLAVAGCTDNTASPPVATRTTQQSTAQTSTQPQTMTEMKTTEPPAEPATTSAPVVNWQELCLLAPETLTGILGGLENVVYDDTRDSSILSQRHVACDTFASQESWVGVEVSMFHSYDDYKTYLLNSSEEMYEQDAAKVRDMKSPQQYMCSKAEQSWDHPEWGEGQCWKVGVNTLSYDGSGGHGWIATPERPYFVFLTGVGLGPELQPYMKKILTVLSDELAEG